MIQEFINQLMIRENTKLIKMTQSYLFTNHIENNLTDNYIK